MLLEEQAVSIISVQSSLIQDWKNASDRSMIPLTFQKRKRFRPNTDAFLVLNFGVLMMAKSKYNVTKNLTLGGSVNFVQASLGAEKTLKGIFTQGEVVRSSYGQGDELPKRRNWLVQADHRRNVIHYGRPNLPAYDSDRQSTTMR